MERNATVIIPTHNYGKWIPNAIDSVLKQTVLPKRIVVIDDNSSDDTEKVIYNGYKKNNRCTELTIPHTYHAYIIHAPLLELTYVKLKHPTIIGKGFGPSYTRNVGINLFWDQTDVWFNLDADDEFNSLKIEQFLGVFQDPKIGLVYADYTTIDESGVKVRCYKEPYSRTRLTQECIVHSGAAFTKDALMRCGCKKGGPIYDNNMRTAEDWDLWLRITNKSLAYHIPVSLTNVRVGSHNSSSTVSQNTWMENWRLIQERLNSGY